MAEANAPLLLGVSGASGMLYLPALLRLAAGVHCAVHGVISAAGRQVLGLELGLTPEDLPGSVRWFASDDFSAPMASGSSRNRGMIVLPCTMGSLGAIASGCCHNLLHRAADVTLKEGRPLILCVRETPLNRTHLRNMLTLHEAGAVIFPLMPSFYHRPAGLEAMAEQLAARVLDLCGITVPQLQRWGEER
ncbi:MAG: aromatic acid decarboxylase [Desulfobulbaceae bacterium A2]|nr:MAG: aromatic acid decarboxylase [Desulfobulbaceae bacterium A2]